MVSSTARDLPEHRQQVLEACLCQGMFPTMMEHLPASDSDAIQASLKMVDEADLYVGVFAFRYGYVPDGYAIGITEMEYNRAVKRDLPRLIFLMHEDHLIKPGYVETGAGAEKLEKFKERLAKERVVNFFKSPDDLGKQVINSLSQYRTSGGAAPRALHRLPPPPAGFTGREAELDELRTAIEQGEATTSGLQGQRGVGKTALALKLGEELSPKFPDAQIYMDLRGASEKPLTAVEVMAHVVRAFYPEGRKLPESADELKPIYLWALAGKRALLVMDNARDAAQVAPLVPPPGSALIVTSRSHFAIPGLRAKNLDTLPPADAKVLLLSITPRIDGEAEAIAEACGYLPLALRLAATALAERDDLDPASYARQLANEKERLELLEGTATDPGVEASIGLSYGLLEPETQERWRMLAVFPDTFDVPAAAAVWCTRDQTVILSAAKNLSSSESRNYRDSSSPAAPQNDVSSNGLTDGLEAAQQALNRLAQYSMLEWNEATGRYRLHDPMRDFAESRLSHDERERATRGHAGHYLSVLGDAGRLYQLGGESLKRGLALFDVEWGNIETGQAWAAARAEQDDEAARLCSGYPDVGADCLVLRQHLRERIRWLGAALAAARRLKERRAEGAHLGNLGLAYADLGETRRAIEYYEQSLAIDREIGDRRGEGATLGNLGNGYYRLGETRRAIGYYQQALAIDREIGNRRGEGADLGNLGLACANLGETRRAIEYYEQALAIDREIGNRQGEGIALFNMSLALDKLGEREKAIEHAEAALTIREQIKDPNIGMVRRQIEQWKRQAV